ncbi:MAG: TIGR03032 family protein [Gammaproteobacteria bacterium]|nr:TIGR03032 family protein [Gammaproteobacteria bacterium]
MADSAPASDPNLEVLTSRQFTAWLHEQGLSLALTTYQSGKLFLLGLQANGRLSVFERTFNRCMGLCVHERSLWMSTLYQLWRMEDTLAEGERYGESDRCFVPRVAWTTGDLDVHDIAIDHLGRPVFVNTLFGCLASLDGSHSFVPVWKPPFISKLGAEDRCHLNGLAMENGRPRYCTSVSTSDVADGWRDQRRNGGVVIDVAENAIVGRGFSMPHSPRVYRDRVWLLDSGNGSFGYLDPRTGKFEIVAFCPGYARGLCFTGDFAVIGLSLPRDNKTFQGLALDDELTKRGAAARCGLLVIDLRTGDTVHWVRFDGIVQELYDVAILPGVRRPSALGFKTDEIRRVLSAGPPLALEN